MTIEKLSAGFVQKTTDLGRHGDGGGLWLQVSKIDKRVTKSWLFRYMINGRARSMGLGSVDTFSLAEARDLARDARKLLKKGVDPIAARDAERAANSAATTAATFKQCAEKYISAHEGTWSNPKHRAQWRSTLETYAYPIIGGLPASQVETRHIVQMLEPIWYEKPETAARVRGRVESVLDMARFDGDRSGDNPARWRGHLDQRFPAKTKVRAVKPQPSLPYVQMPAFMADLQQRGGLSARALEVTILTALRSEEAVGGRWSEIDFDAKTWTVPGERMKGKVDHVVPLSDRAIQVLRELPRIDGSEFIFAGGRADTLSDAAMLKVIRDMNEVNDKSGRPRWTDPKLNRGIVPHGFRATFRTWAADRSSYPEHVCEAALAHKIPDKVVAAYNRAALLDKRRRLMTDWAKYCYRPAAAGTVTPIRAAQ